MTSLDLNGWTPPVIADPDWECKVYPAGYVDPFAPEMAVQTRARMNLLAAMVERGMVKQPSPIEDFLDRECAKSREHLMRSIGQRARWATAAIRARVERERNAMERVEFLENILFPRDDRWYQPLHFTPPPSILGSLP